MSESFGTDQLIKNLAKNKGISEEQARKLLQSHNEKEPDHLVDTAEKFKVAGQHATRMKKDLEGLPEPLKSQMALIGSEALTGQLGNGPTRKETLNEHLEALKLHLVDIKTINQMLPDVGGENKPNNGEDSAKLIASAMAEAMKPMTDTLSIIRDQMDQSKKDDMTTLIETLNGNIEKLAAGKASADGGKTTPFEMVNEVKKFTEEMVGSLGVMGFKVSQDMVTSQEVQDRIATALDGAKKRILEEMANNPQEFTEVLKQKGYRITGGPMKWEEVQKLLDTERKKIVEEANEDVRIKELGGIIREAVSGFMGLFQPLVGKWFEEGIDAQAEETKGKTGQDAEGDVINEEVKTSKVPPAS